MNICFFTDMYNIGGGERNLIDLSVSLKSIGHDVIVFLPKDGELSCKLDEHSIQYGIYGLDKINRRWMCGIPIFIDYIRLYRCINKIKKHNNIPSIIHCNSINSVPLGYLCARFFGVNLVWTCHGPWELKGIFKRYFLDLLVYKIIVITPEIYDIVGCKNKHIIPLGILDDVIIENKKYDEEFYKIACVARFQDIKGQDLLVEALALIREKHKNVEVHFYGGLLTGNKAEVDYYNNIVRKIQNLNLENNVVFHGFNPNVRNIMQEYQLLCIPSRYESFSITLIEGLNRGLPVVAPDIGGPGFIITNEVNGLLFKPGDYRDLARQCLRIIELETILNFSDIRKRGKDFSVDNQRDQLLKIYESISGE